MTLTTIHTQVADWDVALWEYLRVWGVETPDVVASIPDIQQPALVITGEGDTVVPVSDSQRLDAELPNSELVILRVGTFHTKNDRRLLRKQWMRG